MTVKFATGSAILSRANLEVIDRFVSKANAQRRRLIAVTGYASPMGSQTENTLLIEERATVVSTDIRHVLHQDRIGTITVRSDHGTIKHFPSQLNDQVAILTAR
jgi:outer membrane protein OmpA-like peptidoglycan-associated protein